MKAWKKPMMLALKAEQLSAHIQAAAVTNCWSVDFR